jgi:3-hydroxyacyl-[acyl-carrier-protein] dehydratase
MIRTFLTDISNLDFDHPEDGQEGIRTVIPHRHEMEQLSGILKFDPENKIVIGFKDVRDDEFWVKGHIPGRPLLPGVLMVEAAAQLCTYYYKRVTQDSRFMGFGGIDKVKFRGIVVPGDRLILICKNTELKTRRAIFDVQGIVGDKIVFEGIIIGMLV